MVPLLPRVVGVVLPILSEVALTPLHGGVDDLPVLLILVPILLGDVLTAVFKLHITLLDTLFLTTQPISSIFPADTIRPPDPNPTHCRIAFPFPISLSARTIFSKLFVVASI